MAKKQTMKDRRHESEGMKKYWHKKEGKYHQTAKDRRDESRAMRVPKSLEGREGGTPFVDGHDPMVGRGDFANMPQHTDMRPFPKPSHYRETSLDDTIIGVDRTMTNDAHQTSKYLSNQK